MDEETKNAVAHAVALTKQERFMLLRAVTEMAVKGVDAIEARIDFKVALVSEWDWEKLRKEGIQLSDFKDEAPVSLNPKLGVKLFEFLRDTALAEDRPMDLQEPLFRAYKKLKDIFDK